MASGPSAFDKIISATHDHFWDPLDKKYIDFDEPWDMLTQPLVDEDLNIALQTEYVSSHLKDPALRAQFVNQSLLRSFSSILHGEQGALNLSASLCHVLYDQGAQEYAANQTREEARHVTAFARYIKARWGRPVACQRGAARTSWWRSSPPPRSTRRSSACTCWSRAWPWAPSPPSSGS